MTPRVSVVVPTKDRLGSLKRALAAVAEQDFRDFEVLVVDDGSVDGTAAWLREQHPDIRVVTLEQSAGAAGARNRGIAQARGELIAFLDDDDVWRPSYLAAQVRHLDANPAAALSYTDHLEIDWSSGRTSMPDTAPLVTRHRTWFEEERAVLSRTLVGDASDRLVRAYRSLFFARVGLGRGDVAFGFRQLGAAFLSSPRWTMSIAARRLLRRARFESGSSAWAAAAT